MGSDITDCKEEQEKFPDLSKLPACYRLKEVFNKFRATSLPPHRPYDCPIELLPGAAIPKGRLYSISGPEREAMNDYLFFIKSRANMTILVSGRGWILLR